MALNTVGHEGDGQAGRQDAAPMIFLHTSWRSGGTWLWSECRARPAVCGLYEPLHEAMATLRASEIARLRPGSWQSGHAETAPYFQEYARLLRPGGRGVPLYQRRFAFDAFFLDADADDPALLAYLRMLVTAATADGLRPVLKFCRSSGRVAWMERQFPDILHAVVLRSPVAQWRSCQRLLLRERNRYFTLAPLLVLARNADHPRVAAACDALDVRLPVLHSLDLAYGLETAWRHYHRQDADQRYRAFLAYWTAAALAALEGGAAVIEPARLAADPALCAPVTAALAARIGAGLALAPRREPPDGVVPGGMLAAHRLAAALVGGTSLPSCRQALLLEHLGPAGPMTRRSRPVPPPDRPARPGLWRRVQTTTLVLLARALQPLRRLRGEMAARRRRQ